MNFLLRVAYLLGLSTNWAVYTPPVAPQVAFASGAQPVQIGTQPLQRCSPTVLKTVAAVDNFATLNKVFDGKTVLASDAVVITDAATGEVYFTMDLADSNTLATPSAGTDLLVRATLCG